MFNSESNGVGPSSPAPSVGLFCVPGLDEEEFNLLGAKCVEKTEQLVEEALSVDRSRKMVEVLDEIYDLVGTVTNLTEFIINVAHPCKLYTEAAKMANTAVKDMIAKLNSNSTLYNMLREVVNEGDKIPTNEVDDAAVKLFLFDFELNGLHLSEIERNRVLNLQCLLQLLGDNFTKGSSDYRIVKTDLLLDSAKDSFEQIGNESIVSDVCRHSANLITRQAAYRIYLQHDDSQDYLLTELLSRRHQLAQIYGFPTYAHFMLRRSAIADPEMVMEILNLLSDRLKNRASKDYHIMFRMKQEEYINSGTLAMWDIPYYWQTGKTQLFDIQLSDYAPYFSLGSCMKGVRHLLVKLFGISLIATEMLPGESWADDVCLLTVTHETEGILGYIYCDFYKRQDKILDVGSFLVQGGRRLPDGSYQLPILVFTLNLPQPVRPNPTLLLPRMVNELFYHMGTAVHHMLARTQYQQEADIYRITDFADVPSELMVFFATDPRVLRTFARHFETKEPMPEDMLEKLCASKRVFAAAITEFSLFYSALHMLYHGMHPLDGSTTEVLVKAQARYYSVPYVKGTAWQLRLGHLADPWAKHYCISITQSIVTCIWQNCFEKDPLNRTQGERYRREFLAYGGGKPIRQLLAKFLHKEVTTELLVDSLLKEIDNNQAFVQRVQREVS